MEDGLHEAGQRLAIDIGTPLFLEVRGIPGKYKSRLIGMDAGRYLIITMPHCPEAAACKVDEDTFLKVRYVHGGNVFGFTSFVKGVITSPVRLLVIAYPKQVAEQSLRKSERFDCYLPCKAGIHDATADGTIVDISIAGCRCVMPYTPTDQADDHPSIDDTITLKLTTHEAGELVIKGTIVNTTEYHGAVRLGISFGEPEPATARILEKVIMPFTMD